MTLVPSFTTLLQPLACVMTAPSFENFLTLVTGWAFARRSTVTNMLLAAGAVGDGHKHHSAYHRFFSAAQWSLDELGLTVFGLLVLPLLAAGLVTLVVDDTLARKRGLKVYGVGMHREGFASRHDPLISSRKKALTSWGHSWVILGVLVSFPFAGRCFCLPVLFRLYVSKQTITKRPSRYGAYRTKPELAVQMLRLLCKRHPGLRFHLLADSAYGGKSVLLELPGNCELTSRLLLDARLFDGPPAARNPKGGRPRKRGSRLPAPRQMLQGRCRRVELDIYGRHDKSRVAECVARAYAAPGRPLKVVAVEPLTGGREPQAFYSTRHESSAEQVLTGYASRYSIEDTIHEAKGQLGFEQPQGWTKRAVRRTAPLAMLLYTLVVLWFAREGHAHYQAPERPWYRHKTHASFADMLATLRECSVRHSLQEDLKAQAGRDAQDAQGVRDAQAVQRVLATPAQEQGLQNLLQALITMVKLAA